MKTKTKGNVVLEDIKIGDLHYEFGPMGIGIKSEVISVPVINESGQWEWKSKNTGTGTIISYSVDPENPQFSPNLYDYEAYKGFYYLEK